MSRFWNILRQWLPLAVTIVGLIGVIYIVAQQGFRLGANDLPAQLAHDGAEARSTGADPASLVGQGTVELSQELGPFIMVFDESGAVVASSAQLRGKVPEVPPGVLDVARLRGEDRVTWQPEYGVRMATVTVRVRGGPGGFVLAGHSLLEAEKHIDQAGLLCALGAIAILVGSLVAVVFCEFALPKASRAA